MEHFISANIESGIKSTLMIKAPLGDVLKEALSKAPERKEDCWLISNGYSDKKGKYTREEFNFTSIDTILIDCDNDKDNPDPSLLRKFQLEYEPYSYFLWETASSSPTCPKFRAILLLDMKIEWVNEPDKFTKHAIQQHFSRWVDDKASWFFTPPKGKVGTFVAHNGKPYPSAPIVALANLNREIWEMKQPSKAEVWDRENLRSRPQFNENGWRNLPTVKYCLGGLLKGERDQSICKACYAMANKGYRDKIPEFLDELIVPQEFKNKFKNKYR